MAKDSIAGNQYVGTCLDHSVDGIKSDAAIDLNAEAKMALRT